MLCLSKFYSFIYSVDSDKMVGVPGFEPGTSSLSGMRSNQLSYTPSIRVTHDLIWTLYKNGGAEGIRTLDPLRARQVL